MTEETIPLENGINFYLLGAPYVHWGEKPLEISRRQVRHLLYYLAINQEPVAQELLRFYFWPHIPDQRSRRYLTHLIHHARKSLPVRNVLVKAPEQISLDRKLAWCDVDVLRSREHICEILDQKTAELVSNTLKLYRGPLLKGLNSMGSLEFENDLDNHRWHLERVYLHNLHNLIVWETRQGHYQSALEYANKYLMIDEMCEEIHQHLISLYALLRDRQKVVAQFHTCQQILERELKLQPSLQTKKIYQDAMEGRIHHHFGQSQLPNLQPQGFPKGDFIGRRLCLEKLIDWTEAAIRGDGGLTILHGELGIGKTRLIQEVAQRMSENTLVLWSNCYPGTQNIPLQPLVQTLRYISRCGPSFSKFPTQQLEDFFRLMTKPLPGAFKDDVPSLPGEEFSKVFFYSRIGEIYMELGRLCYPVLFCLEDLQYADMETLEFLNFFASQLSEEKFMIILTYCCKVSPPLKQCLSHLQMLPSYRGTIHLAGLDEPETAELVNSLLESRKVSAEFISQLWNVSGGNPLFVTEILELFNQTRLPFMLLSDWANVPLPATLQKAIKFNLDQLNNAPRDLLNLAAVLGHPFTYEQICQISDQPAGRILDHLDELVNRHFLVEVGTHYRFKHKLLQTVILERMSAARIRELKRCSEANRSQSQE